MKKIKIILIALISLISVILIYFNTNNYIAAYKWKYRDGYHIGDSVEFNRNNNNYKIVICFGNLIIIKKRNGFEYGYYINKGV
jgi:hypothetical protein